MYCSSPSLMGENWRFRNTGYCLRSLVVVVVIVRAIIVTNHFSHLQRERRLLLCVRRRALRASVQVDHASHCEQQKPNGWSAVGGIGELDQIGQPANQQGHTGHYGVAERRAEGDHEEENSSPRDRSTWPRMLNREEKVEQHRADADQNDNHIETASRTQHIPAK